MFLNFLYLLLAKVLAESKQLNDGDSDKNPDFLEGSELEGSELEGPTDLSRGGNGTFSESPRIQSLFFLTNLKLLKKISAR